MMGSIVDQLAHWLRIRRANLVQAGIEITDLLPQPSSNIPWKGTVGLAKDDILVSYTVWERIEYQSELIIVDGKSGETIRCDDASPGHPEEIEAVLDAVVNDLVAGTYLHIKPQKA
jgi:hypothetical protein